LRNESFFSAPQLKRIPLGGAKQLVTKRTRMVGFLLLSIAIAGGLFVAWQYWPPLLKYREVRLQVAYNDEIRRYLKGSDSLELAAHRLAAILVKLGEVAERQNWGGAGGEGSSMTITAISSSSDVPRDDPRVEELVLNAFKLANPAEASEPFKARSAQMWDSIIHSKGYRSVP
jgi:hypothetical protein